MRPRRLFWLAVRFWGVMLVVWILVSAVAHADLAGHAPTFNWNAITVDAQGHPLPATGGKALRDYRIFCDGVTTRPKFTIVAPVTTYQSLVSDFTDGAHTCWMHLTNNDGELSAKSLDVTFTLVPLILKPAPTTLTVQ